MYSTEIEYVDVLMFSSSSLLSYLRPDDRKVKCEIGLKQYDGQCQFSELC